MRRACVAVLIILSLPSLLTAQAQVQVLTQHNNNARTGANLSETQLNVSNVGSGQFGFIFSLPVDGAVYAQPLYVPALTIADGSVHNVVYIATMHNVVYAFDADNPSGQMLWQKSLGLPNLPAYVPQNFMPLAQATAGRTTAEQIAAFIHSQFKGCGPVFGNPPSFNIQGGYGVTGTPVIDLTSNTLFAVAKTPTSDGFGYFLHALNLQTGNERAGSPVAITGHVAGTGVGSKGGTLAFDPKMNLQRPGLLLSNGTVYIAFGAHQDTPPYHGWIFAFDAQTLQQKTPGLFSTTPNGDEGGIWQSGNGLAADPSGNIYFMTGNGQFDGNHGGTDLGDSFVKLDQNLNIVDWFTPSDFSDMDSSDVDLGSAGPILLPNSSSLVGGGKKGVFYLLDQNNMGHLEDDTHAPLQKFQATQGIDNTLVDIVGGALIGLAAFDIAAAAFDFAIGNVALGAALTAFAAVLIAAADVAFSTNMCGADFHHIHGSPVVWNSPKDGPLVYVWGERDKLKAFKFDPFKQRFPSTSPAYESSMKDPDSGDPRQKFMPGGILSISANGSTAGTGILWASLPQSGNAIAALQPGVLRAFDAENIGHELWCASVGTFAKFNPATIANGKVYLATFDNRVNVYGLSRQAIQTGWLGGYKTESSPFVSNGYVYFQGTENRLFKVNINNPNGDNTWLGGYKTESSPFVSDDGYVYFQGTENRLFKVNVNNPNGDNTWLGGYKIFSSPFVSNGYVYFQGSDNKLFKVNVNNPNGDNTWLGGYKIFSSPFVADGYVYFQGSDSKLFKVNVNNPNGDNTWLGGYKTLSSPSVSNGYVYFQGTENRLFKVNVNNPNGDNTWLDGLKTKSSPFVENGAYVYFQGTDNTLYRVSTDGNGLASPGCTGNSTKSTPFVYGNGLFFQGTDDRLLVVGAYE